MIATWLTRIPDHISAQGVEGDFEMNIKLLNGNVLDMLKTIADESVDCIVKFNKVYSYIEVMTVDKGNILLAYLAGAIDSDGSISIKRSTYGKRKLGDRISPMYYPRISLRQISPIVPNLLRKTFGGGIYISKPNAKRGKLLYCYEATNLIAEHTVRKLLQYLILKKRQAEIILELQEIRKNGKDGHISGYQKNRWGKYMVVQKAVISDITLKKMLDLYLEIRKLNDTRYDKLHWPQDLPLPEGIQ